MTALAPATRPGLNLPVSDQDRDQDQLFRDAMSRFPSGVTIVTTTDAEGTRWGFTASAFCSLSMDPRLVLICLSTSANSYPAFANAAHWVIHIVHQEQTSLARQFASRGADKFVGVEWGANDRGMPVLPEATVTLDCEAEAIYPGGDHVVLVGRVVNTTLGEFEPTVYYRRQFHQLP